MIYLIECEGRNETYYKIGYTRDSNFEQRLNTYKLHNPFCKVLYTIPDATEDHERLIQAKFSKYQVYRKEWFKSSVEILRFFDRHRTKESLDNEFNVSNLSYFIRGADGRLTDRYIDFKREVKRLINTYCTKRLTKDNSEEIAKEYDTLVSKYVPILGKTIFSIEEFKECFSEGDLNNVDVDLGDDIKKFLEDFNTLPDFSHKMKFLCEAGVNLSTEDINVVLDQIPLTYKKYYIGVGPDRCRARRYSLTGIKKEYDDLFVAKDIKEGVYRNFNEGDKYSLKELKERLRVLYGDIGYNKTPKASDINNYFETERVRIKGIEGLRLLIKKL